MPLCASLRRAHSRPPTSAAASSAPSITRHARPDEALLHRNSAQEEQPSASGKHADPEPQPTNLGAESAPRGHRAAGGGWSAAGGARGLGQVSGAGLWRSGMGGSLQAAPIRCRVLAKPLRRRRKVPGRRVARTEAAPRRDATRSRQLIEDGAEPYQLRSRTCNRVVRVDRLTTPTMVANTVWRAVRRTSRTIGLHESAPQRPHWPAGMLCQHDRPRKWFRTAPKRRPASGRDLPTSQRKRKSAARSPTVLVDFRSARQGGALHSRRKFWLVQVGVGDRLDGVLNLGQA